MKYVVVLLVGVAMGVGAMLYRDDTQVRASTNAHLDSAVSSAATAAHNALQQAKK
jgi:hypothetical protein